MAMVYFRTLSYKARMALSSGQWQWFLGGLGIVICQRFQAAMKVVALEFLRAVRDCSIFFIVGRLRYN